MIELRIRKKLQKSAAEVLIILILLLVSLLTLGAIYIPLLSPFSQWSLAITPLAVALTTFYLSFIIAQERRKRDMAKWVYTPLLKEVKTWLDPNLQSFNQWGTIKEEQPYLARRMPKDVFAVFKKADRLFREQWRLRASVTMLVNEATDRLSVDVLKGAGFNTNDTSANIAFYIRTEGGTGEQPVYPIWIIQTNMTVSEYADDYSRKNYPKGSGWGLKTVASPKTGGSMKEAGGTEPTKKWLETIIKSVLKHPDGRDLRKNVQEVKELGQNARLLIGEELD